MDKQKKQTVMVGSLLLVLVAVGAFQFMGPKPAPPTTEEVATATDGQSVPTAEGEGSTGTVVEGEGTAVADGSKPVVDPELEPLVQNQLPVRDPFLPTASAQNAAKENADLANKTATPVATATAPPQRMAGGPSYGGGQVGVYDPIGGPLPTGLGQLPPTGPGGQIGAGGGQVLEPAKRTGYKVVGTIVGKQKMVILEDADGNQVLVPEGKKTPDGKARVVTVQSGKAKVSQEGQVKMLGLEED